MSNYALRIPNSLFDYAKQCAEEESVSMNQFFVMAIAEKVSALKTEAYFRERVERADPARAREILKKVHDVPVMAGDEVAPVPVARESTSTYLARKQAVTAASSKPTIRKPRGKARQG